MAIKANEHFLQLQGNYLFAGIARKVSMHKEAHPGRRIISLGIGDVTLPLPQACIEAMHKAADEMGNAATFRGYGPEQGYDFLAQAIIDNDFAPRGVSIARDEVFISDGAKSDTGNIGDIISASNTVALADPAYPVYIDSNVMCGRAGVSTNGVWSNVLMLPCTAANGFIPLLPDKQTDVIYLCYPNNPTGIALSKGELRKWVDYALANDALLLFDAAYEAFISQDDVPHSIYEIEGAERCAIEFRSFSKTAGFTGIRCGCTIVPKGVTALTSDGTRISLNALWNRRQCTKFNGTSYITQRAAEATYSTEGKKQVRANIEYYMANASYMLDNLKAAGMQVWGGVNSPYLWLKTPGGMGSWQFFEEMLENAGVVCTPGAGFGPNGEGYVRLTAFGNHDDCQEAICRIRQWLG